jgi:hypothetical protein
VSLTLMRTYSALAGLICITGCYPVLSHPTRAESGFRLTSFTSFAMVSDSGDDAGRRSLLFVPSIDFEASLGIRDTSRDDGAGLRLAASGGLSGYGGSAYVEVPRDLFGSFDVGFGVAGHGGALTLWTPYLQFGRYESEDMSWFVRNGIAFTAKVDSGKGSVLWVPTVGIVRHRSSRDAALFLSAVVGSQPLLDGPCLFACSGPSMRTLVMVGASMSFTLMTPYRPDRR